jgi:transglutaminase-like putative cysteine protease
LITSWTHRVAVVAALALAAIGPARATVPQADPPKASTGTAEPTQRRFQLTLRYSYQSIPKNIQGMEFWFPFPANDAAQSVHNAFIVSPYELESQTDPDTGNVFYHMTGGPRGGVPMQTSIRVDIERTEARRDPGLAGATTPEQDKAARERWMRPERLCPLSKEARSRASRATSGRRKTVDKARGIYDYIVNNITLVNDVSRLPGAGQGDLQFVLREMKGSAVDLASAFVGLCRAADIPARTVMGLQVPEGTRSGSILGYHGWAEFYLEGTGWVPVDPAEALRHPSRRDEFFARLDPSRVAISIGRDVTLRPPQKAPPLNFFINPHWEGDGKEMPSPWVEVEFTELDEIPRMQTLPVDVDTPASPAPVTPAPGS